MSDDLIARRMAQRQQQGCESESGVLTINRCYFEHGPGSAAQALRSPLFCSGVTTRGREQTFTTICIL